MNAKSKRGSADELGKPKGPRSPRAVDGGADENNGEAKDTGERFEYKPEGGKPEKTMTWGKRTPGRTTPMMWGRTQTSPTVVGPKRKKMTGSCTREGWLDPIVMEVDHQKSVLLSGRTIRKERVVSGLASSVC